MTLSHTGPETPAAIGPVLTATEEDAAVLGLNSYSDGCNVVIASRAKDFERQLRERGYNPIGIDLSELLLGGGGTDGHHQHFAGDALLFQAHRLFHGDFAEGVHGHLDVGEIDAGVVRLDADLDVVVNHALDRY